ncbi:hypothetical protein [Pseudomonas phage D6]|nr:hypothetical protein [Pseudomonas phage D6]
MSYNQFIFEMTRAVDPELAEDLNRRMTVTLTTTIEMSDFMNGILSQYPSDWAKYWFTKGQPYTIEQWCTYYRTCVLPFFCMHRLPPVAADARPIYPV